MGRDAVVVQRDAAGRDAIGVGRGDGGGKGCVGAVGLGCAAREGIGMDVEGVQGDRGAMGVGRDAMVKEFRVACDKGGGG